MPPLTVSAVHAIGVVIGLILLIVPGLLVLSARAVPFQAHALSVLYYRLVDPQRPAIDPQVRTWPSVWAGPTEVV
jgi:hypothetical protein